MTRCQAVALLILWCFCPRSALAAASVEDAGVLAGYRLFNNGDLASAQQTFERLIAGAPSSLPAQFGLLQVIEQRSEGERVLEPEFERRIDAFLATAEERFARSDKDDEALFYLANGYMLRATYRLDHDKGIWGAARDGARAKRFSEQYVQRHPEHGDAYFALGTYNYYVEIAPTFIKIIRLFLFLPPGNRAAGLQQLERAHAQGSLFAPQAGLMLMEIYGSFESRPADAVRIGERLAAQYHDSPKVQFSLAELYEGPAVEDHERAAATYQRIIDNEDRRAGAERPAKYQARLGLAGARFSRWRTNESFAVLDAVIDRKPATPVWVMPTFLLRRSFYRGMRRRCSPSRDGRIGTGAPPIACSGSSAGDSPAKPPCSRHSFPATGLRWIDDGMRPGARTSRCSRSFRIIAKCGSASRTSRSGAARQNRRCGSSPPSPRTARHRTGSRPRRCCSSVARTISRAGARTPSRCTSGSWIGTKTRAPPGRRKWAS
jgi:hypothetical protein